MKAIVIGGGIIGLCSAYYLQKSGWQVTVTDRSDLTDNCSYGNLGMIVPSHFVPLAAPGMVTQGIWWMLNNKSPFYIKPSFDSELISWGWNFIKSATAAHVEKAAPYLLELNLLSKKLYEELAAQPGFDLCLENKGILMYYRTQRRAEEEMHLAEKAGKMGLDTAILSQQQVQELEPQIELNILGAVHYKNDAHLYPNHLMPQLITHLKDAGVTFILNDPVDKFIIRKNVVEKVITATAEESADIVVLAAGAWLPQLARMAGIPLSLLPGKGYSFTVNEPVQQLNIPAILCEARVAITPMQGKMRYGGTMEIGKVNDNINLKRVEGIVEAVSGYFPGLSLQMPGVQDIWYGFRPCTPDGLPYIGYAKELKNVLIAGGHAMSGLSLGPATGRIIAQLADGKTPSVKIDLFNPGRFS